MLKRMNKTVFTVEYYSDRVQADVLALPEDLLARYFTLLDRMELAGSNLGEPHTKAFGDGLFELRVKASEGIARVFFCTRVGRRIVMLHCFVKKSEKTPPKERRLAEQRLKEIKNADA